MKPITTPSWVRNLRRRGVWINWVFTLPILIILACAGTTFGPQKCQSDERPYDAPNLAADSQDAKMRFVPASGSQVELQGTATIGSWISRSSQIQGKIVLDADAAAFNALFDQIQSALPMDARRMETNPPALSIRSPSIGRISVPVTSLHGGSSGMDRDLQNALKVGQYADIEYVFQQLKNAALQWDPRDHRAEYKLDIAGELHMAGKTRPISMAMIVRRDAANHWTAHARTALLMTDFGVTPPGALFGLIKADDKVDVIFDLDLVLMNPSPGNVPPLQAADAPSR